jgi:predicted RNase H-like nuclease
MAHRPTNGVGADRMTVSAANSIVAGADGCPAGWITVYHPRGRPDAAAWRIFPTFEELLAFAETFEAVAVDMPIGLPDVATTGGREADRLARSVLGARQSSVFAVPARATIACTDYAHACATNLLNSDPPRKVAKQMFYLFAKIREIDERMTPTLQQRVVECHPEVAFWALNGEQALAEPKKVKSRPFPAGLDLRRDLLSRVGYAVDFLAGPDCPRSRAAPDDLLDACATAWSANRLALGAAARFPDNPPRDSRGLRMEIVY